MVTLYTTPTCGTCKVAERRLDDAGVEFEKVDLTEHPDTLEDIRERLGIAPGQKLQLPILGFEGELHTIVGLRDIIRTAVG
ncbi:NrdH-like glutaredoxin [Microbacterium phage Jovita]|uniref:NrdH-like glutaredoxin n=1 Tax=Microbacterium phage Lynlen TaxID=2725651 RepID=UPI0014639F27|nr:NrdH-like glutaredoxin [Microbacterium phage Lynlen]YP_010753532.1 NrdH-like glutaredoxin [Microbacterium phage Kenzers]YP_010753672.1 NrdH-like glutaredoxin [Microbacterium phage QMacho]YP_010753811.1 NrdH-like glutaredoxin [Microbacterium phage Jovita]WNM67939.1 NrdH-like glutaredoxin [Microbacterium phage Albedo]QJD53445.1 NrdH-like glutaredoxin [Microbacterium phage Lynlen]UVT31665.1 NrdH-like glutaredoxin [Microbacterium phage Kenzers]UYL86341.1 NrdH-like glutaredoxin [Microbacterium